MNEIAAENNKAYNKYQSDRTQKLHQDGKYNKQQNCKSYRAKAEKNIFRTCLILNRLELKYHTKGIEILPLSIY